MSTVGTRVELLGWYIPSWCFPTSLDGNRRGVQELLLPSLDRLEHVLAAGVVGMRIRRYCKMTVDWTKPIQTRNGLRAEFVRRVKSTEPATRVWCVVFLEDGREQMRAFSEDGLHLREISEYDIINVPEEKVLCVVNVYENGWPRLHYDRTSADRLKDVNRTHVVTIKRIGDEVTATVERVQ